MHYVPGCMTGKWIDFEIPECNVDNQLISKFHAGG
jgi:hypothetical protein